MDMASCRAFLEKRFAGCQVTDGLLARAVEALRGATGAEVEAVADHVILAAALEHGASADRLPIHERHLRSALQGDKRAPRQGVMGFEPVAADA
jgi:hypothetical protein